MVSSAAILFARSLIPVGLTFALLGVITVSMLATLPNETYLIDWIKGRLLHET